MSWQTIDGELVLLDVDGKELMGVNEVGGFIWSLMDGIRTVEDIARAVAREFEVSVATASADVRAFVSELQAQGAVVVAGPGSSSE